MDCSNVGQHKCQVPVRACSKRDILILLHITVGCVCVVSRGYIMRAERSGTSKIHTTHARTHALIMFVCAGNFLL